MISTDVQGAVDGAAQKLDTAVAGVGLRNVFQPIVSLPDESIIGFEALARWPQLDYPDPRSVLAHAAATGRVGQLDKLCIRSAIESALAAGIGRSSMVFINSEPGAPYVSRAHDDLVARGHHDLRLVFELTERDLLTDPPALMRKVAALRSDGFAIALDDVGAHPDSLALLDVVSPDVIKLDLNLAQSERPYDQARTVSAILAHRQRTGAIILAEGIETAQHSEHALALGATLGQGFKYGRPGALRAGQHPTVDWSLPPRKQPRRCAAKSPFDVVAGTTPVRTVRKNTLLELSRYIEGRARIDLVPPMVLAAVQQADRFAGETRRRYKDLAAVSPLVVVFAQDLPEELGSAIHGVCLDPTDALCAEWVVLVLGPTTATALIARDHGDSVDPKCRDSDRTFDLAVTNDRSLVTLAAGNLLDRML
ncbi:MAG: EAL domain-containing protein [Mycobacterium sp.]